MANKSYVIYDGPSEIDGKPIVAIAQVKTGNRKTGDMVQTWILRSDVDPITASRTGEDVSICGDCPHKGTPSDKATGWDKGERTFRVISSLDKIIKGKEILCPASEEAKAASGKTVTCSACKLCGGNSIKAKSVAIVAHGTAKQTTKGLVE